MTVGRAGRALVLIGLAAVVVAAAGVGYLHAVVPSAPAARRPGAVPALDIPRGSPISMDWRSTTTGWVVMADVNSESLVFKTTDGGRHWRLQLAAPGSSYTVQFFDDRHGLLLPDRPLSLLYQNPASTYCVRPSPLAPSPCAETGPNVVLVPARMSLGTYVAAYRTDDGGDRWLSVPVPPQSTQSPTAFTAFGDVSHGWILTITGLAATREQEYFELSRTEDGGRHWTELMRDDPG